jgi:hypothetical protein
MGVSYWEVGQRERAYEMTEAGVQLVEQGVAEGLIAAETLTVPQGNLNAMARALGKAELSTPQQPTESRTQVARKSRSNSRQTRTAGRATTNDGSRRR